jgi:hypothetical protein
MTPPPAPSAKPTTLPPSAEPTLTQPPSSAQPTTAPPSIQPSTPGGGRPDSPTPAPSEPADGAGAAEGDGGGSIGIILGIVAGVVCAGGAYAYVKWKKSHSAKLGDDGTAAPAPEESRTSLEISPVKSVVKETPNATLPDV